MKTKTRKQKKTKTKASAKLENKSKCKILLLNKDIREKHFSKYCIVCKKKRENEGGAELFPAFY